MTSSAQYRTRQKKPRHACTYKPLMFQADRAAGKVRRQALGFTGWRRQRWKKTMHKIKDANWRRRYQIIWHFCTGFSLHDIAQMLCCHRNTVAKVVNAYQVKGELGLVDGRVGNGQTKVTQNLLNRVEALIAGQPDASWNHSTWTQELLASVLAEESGLRLSVATICRLLKRLKARKGRPRPVVHCPWPARKRQRRLRDIRKLIETLPADEIALFEDEVDIHLNPKIGPDWMLPGTQKQIVTPGQNQKYYVAGAITAWGGDLIWVAGPRKRSALFIDLIDTLCEHFQAYKVIHLVVDNFIIHSSKITQKAIEAKKGKVRCHFLPPYCPQHNPIERLWRDLHARVTRNHRCKTIDELMHQVAHFLDHVWAYDKEPLALAA